MFWKFPCSSKLPLHGLKARVRHACTIIWSTFFEEIINSDSYAWIILEEFSRKLTDENNVWLLHAGQCNVLHRKILSDTLQELCNEWLITHRQWLPRSIDLNWCNYYLWWILKEELMWTTYILCKNKKTIFEEDLLIIHVKSSVMCLELYSYGKACLEDGVQHFGLLYEINEVVSQGNKIDNVCIM